MKKSISTYMLAVASLIAFSCTSEKEAQPVTPAAEGVTLVAEREGLDPATRSAVQPDGKSVWWSAGDKITVFAGAGTTGSVFTSNETEASKTAKFSGEISSASTYYAAYPAEGGPSVDAGGTITVTVPSAQQAVAGSFDPKAFPTIAQSETLSMKFYNTSGGIKFAVSEDGISSVVIKGCNDEDIAGTAGFAFEGGVPVLKSVTKGEKEIVLTAPEGGFVQGTYYYAVLLPVTLQKGINITLKHSGGVPDSELVSSKARTIKRSTFGVIEGLNSIIASNGKVRFYLRLDGNLRSGLGLQDGTVKDWSVSVNARVCVVKTDDAGRSYIEIAENADKKYDAAIYNSNSPMWYGANVLTDVVVPYSQFWSSTAQEFAGYPRYASYSPESGNILSFSDAVALINVKLNGSASASSVKVRSLDGKALSGKAAAESGALKLTESLDWAVVNCTNKGSFVSMPATVPVIIAPGDYSGGLEITVCDSEHKMVRTTVYPGVIEAGQTYETSINYTPDSTLLFYEGFDNFVWGGDIMGGEGSVGYAPDSDKPGITDGKDRDGYANAFTKVSYDYPGSSFIQSNTWNEVKTYTLSTSHIVPLSYINSRNLADWKYLYRCQEYHGAIAAGLEVNRGVVQTPAFSEIKTFTDAVISFKFCLRDGCDDDLLVQLVYGGKITSIKIDGVAADAKIDYNAVNGRGVLNHSGVSIPASLASKKEWHTCEITAENLTDASSLYFAGNSTSTSVRHGFYLDDIQVNVVPGTDGKKGSLRVLYWNIDYGMWADQHNNYNNFVNFVKRYDPDICVWTEGATVFKDNSTAKVGSDRYLPNGWNELAARYGHGNVGVGGIVGTTYQFPQIVTSKYPISTIKKISTASITRGAGMFRVTVNGKTIDIVTGHMWPESSSPSSQISNGALYREYEMDYIIKQTINNSSYSSTTNWILVGDFNSPSRLDIPIIDENGSPTADKYKCQNVVLDKTDMIDVMSIAYRAGVDFVSSTYGNTDRRDYMYVSPALSGKVVRAFNVNDSWTKTKGKGAVSDMNVPSDHRPMLVEFNF